MEELKELHMFGSGKLKLSFEDNKAKLFWKGRELTKGLAVHTALNANGKWYDSSGADWHI